jgi:hydroxyacylglutathione hydrolase
MASLEIVPVAVLTDNYVWLLRDQATGTVAVVDPGEAAPVEAALAARGWQPALILLTHHHGDHVGGVAALKAAHGAAVVGAAADAHRLPALDRALAPGETVAVGECVATVIDTPGHTRGHIAYHFAEAGVLACGDTLFSLGCGRPLEGTPEEMFASLGRLATLPDATLVLCGHEYTQSNARFALTVEPENAALRARAAEADAQRAAGRPTLPVTLGAEKAANPFLRARDAAEFARLRAAKDSFR